MNTTTRIAVNQDQLLAKLGFAFSTKTTLISELMQNARRAGASKIDINFREDDGVLSLLDDGKGIDDFNALLTLASSGWDQETVVEEKAFGIGFFASIYAAKSVTVYSNGRFIEFDTAEALAGGEIQIQTGGSVESGTLIVLRGLSLKHDDVKAAVLNFAYGFPLPVMFNATEVARPHAMSDTFADVGIGLLKLDEEHLSSNAVDVYLQGLPIAKLGSRYSVKDHGYHILHLDSEQFIARLPDRDQLIDAHEQERRIMDVLHDHVRSLLADRMDMITVDAEQAQWLIKHAAVLNKWKCQSLANAWDVVPTCWFYHTDVPTQKVHVSYLSCISHSTAWLTRSDIEAGKVTLFDNAPGDLELMEIEGAEVHSWAAAMWAHKSGWLAMGHDGYLARDHWAHALVKDLSELVVTVSWDESAVKTTSFSGNFVCADIVLVDSYQLHHNGDTITVSDCGLALGEDSCNAMLLLPNTGCISEALHMASSYCGEYDDYMESDANEDENLVLIAIAGLSSPADSLKCLLDQQDWALGQGNLDQASVLVQIDRQSSCGERVRTFDAAKIMAAVKAVLQDATPDAINALRAAANPLLELPASA